MSPLDDYTTNTPTSPFRDAASGETAYIDPKTMRDFAQAILDALPAPVGTLQQNWPESE